MPEYQRTNGVCPLKVNLLKITLSGDTRVVFRGDDIWIDFASC